MKKQMSNHELSKYSKELLPLLAKIVSGLGFHLLELSCISENQTNYLRLTILHPDHQISLDDCELVSKGVEKELDCKNLIPFSYVLEVQSQGTDKGRIEHEFVLKSLGLTVKT